MNYGILKYSLFLVVSFLTLSLHVFSQEKVVNKSLLPDDVVAKKIALIDSARKFQVSKEQQDHSFYKALLEQGYSRQQVDSLHKISDPDFLIPTWYPPSDETRQSALQIFGLRNAEFNSAEKRIPVNTGEVNKNVPDLDLNLNLNHINPTRSAVSERKVNSVVPHSSVSRNDAPPIPMVTGPEQNCSGAIAVCQQTYTQSQSYTGYGYQEVYGTCLQAKEQYSVWYVFTVQTSGTFGFSLSTLKDYDFALYDLTAIGGCANVPTSSPVRCNFSSTYGNTGMSASGVNPSESASGIPWSTMLNVTAGTTYALIIDNFTMDATGYTLTFTGTASIYDNIPPTLSNIVNNCNGTLTLTFSEPVKCSSIVASDFTISGGGSITGVSGCTAGTLTNSIVLSYTAPSTGTYTIGIQVGGDGNTILDKCNNTMSTSQTITFNHLGSISITSNPASGIVCQGSPVTLTATNVSGASYVWSPSSSATYTAVVTPATSTIYDVNVSYGGCTKNASYAVTIQAKPVVTISPMNPILCSGTTNLTASANPCSGCTYNWTGSSPAPATGATLNNCGAGTFTVTATSSIGCVSNPVSTTVSLASSPPSNTCNIYYVTPNGSGTKDGLSVSNACDASGLSALLSSVACSGATIRLAVGVYNISSSLSINSNTTIEGGYKSDFSLKYSMDGTSNYTSIIRRDNTNAVSNNIIAFKVNSGSTNFRFQDLRIETPGSLPLASNPLNSASINNYAIYLESGCSNYVIMRCHIDGGQGGVGPSAKQVFTYTGSDQTFNVPAGVSSVDVKLWGAGGGGSWYISSYLISGGSGGYVGGTLAVTPSSSLKVIVGQAGYWGRTTSTYGGGGGSYSAYPAAGGGRSAIQITAGTDAVTAGGGGGAGTMGINNAGSSYNWGAYGGAGGGTTAGSAGSDVWEITSTATGGTQASGGTRGTGLDYNGNNGSQYQGGTGHNNASTGSGGGGGGYYGGGSGGGGCDCYFFFSCGYLSSGGGGGSSYLGSMTSTSNLIGNTAADGSAPPAPNNTDGDYVAGVGKGGAGSTVQANTYGGNGEVVISYNVPGGNAYGIYGVATQSTYTITDCEVSTQGGATQCNVCLPTTYAFGSASISTYPVISTTSVSCTNIVNTYSTSAASPGTWNGGSNASPATGAAVATYTTQYTGTGYKDVTNGSNVYKGFKNIITGSPSSGTIQSAYTNGCPGAYYFANSLGGTPGFSFAWSEVHTGSTSVTVTFSPANTYSSNVTFTNTTSSVQTVTVSVTPTSQCCGALSAATYTFNINPLPPPPTITPSSYTICSGGSATLAATAPSNSSFDWYNSLVGGSPFASGPTCVVSPGSTTTYYCESTNAFGCVGTPRTPVTVTVNQTSPPTAPGVSSCGPDNLTISVSSPIAGATYNFYSGNCSGLLQSSTSPSYTSFFPAATTIYVSVQLPGCNESTCTAVPITFSSSPTSVTWNGTTGGTNNWFIATNWTPNCLPTCVTDVSIPSGTPSSPDIGFNATYGNAESKSITIANGATLSFSDVKAQLDVCGNFTHSGTITTNSKGKINFRGSVPQSYAQTSTGSGELYNVIISNTAAFPAVTIKTGSGYQDMVIATNGTFSFQSGLLITEGARRLLIKNSTSSSLSGHGTSSYVFGRITRYVVNGASYDFPVGGDPSGTTVYPYELLNITFATITGLNDLTVCFDNPTNITGNNLNISPALIEPSQPTVNYSTIIDHGGANTNAGYPGPISGIWTVIPNAGTATYTMTVYGKNYDNATIAGPNYTIIKRNTYSMCSPVPAWVLDGTPDPANSSPVGNILKVSRTGMSGFSQFSIGKSPVALPVELIAFDATCSSHNTVLSWATASETNNNYFTIERSCGDPNNFVFLANIQGSGNSNTIKQYSYTDTDFPGGTCYYRLSQTDFDGTNTQFEVIAANCENNSGFSLISIMPIPADNDLTVLFTDDEIEKVSLDITDVLGQRFLNKEMKTEIGLNRFSADLTNFSSGVYFVKLYNDNKTIIKRVIKK